VAIALRGTPTSTATDNTSAAIPTGTTTGDVMVLFLFTNNTGTPAAVPTGWTNVTSAGANNKAVRVVWRAWQSGDAAPTVSGTTSSSMHSYSGCSTADPIGGTSTNTSSAQDTTVEFGTITLENSTGSSAIVAGFVHGNGNTATASTNFTERTEVNDGTPMSYTQDDISVTSGTIGAVTTAGGGNEHHTSAALELLLAPVSINVGLVSAGNSALAISKTTSISVGLVAAPSVALALTKATSIAVGLVQTTDVALSITVDVDAPTANIPVGLVSDVNTALAISKTVDIAAGLAQSGNTALAVTKTLDIQVGLVATTDVAQSISKSLDVPVGLAIGTDVALTITYVKDEAFFTFRPPRYEVGETRRPLFRYYSTTVADSIVRISGTLQSIRSPHSDLLAGLVEGSDYFLGGRVYVVTSAVRAELVAAGYTVE
jgi:hypothetical protein